MEETLEDGPSNCLQVVLPPSTEARAVAQRLRERHPRVLLHVYGNSLAVAMEVVLPGEEAVIGERILQEIEFNKSHRSSAPGQTAGVK
jgi:hypothetical protein